MSWSIEEHIGEGRPWPVQVVVYRGETGECLSYVSGEVADRLKAENATLRDYIERKRALQDFARLVEERGELREFCAELYGFVSRADRMQYPELGDRMRELATENDRLQASNEVIAEDHAALCEQNTKLRELLAKAGELIVIAGWPDVECDEMASAVMRGIREMGVEVS